MIDLDKSGKITEAVAYYPVLITLILSGLSASISGFLAMLFLIEIGETFNVTVGMAGQMVTVNAVISIIFSFLTGILSLRYSHKALLQVGLFSYVAAAVGIYLAPNFIVMIAFFSLTGIGYALTTTMVFTLIGELLPVEKKGEATGFTIAGMSSAFLIGTVVVPYIQGIGGWRSTFIGYLLPVSALTLILATILISRKPGILKNEANLNFRGGLKTIFSNRSAFFSLLGLFLAMAAWQGTLTYNTSFQREEFRISIGEASLFILLGATLYTIGSITTGRMVNRFGSKFLSSSSIMISGIAIMLFSYLPTFLTSSALLCLACFLVGVMDVASTSLIMEQVPSYTGVMMSLSRAVTQFGSSVGSGVGGMLLLFTGYRFMFTSISILAIASAIAFYLFTIDPLARANFRHKPLK